MKAQAEALSSVKIKLTIEVEPGEYAAHEKTAIARINRSVAVPGFRKGKAPESTIRKLFGDRMRSEAVSGVIEAGYAQALRDMKIWPVDDPDVSIDKFDPAEGITFTATVEVRPEVKASGYTGLSFKKEKAVVDDAVVEARLEEVRRQAATFEPAPEDAAAENGDLAVIDFEGMVDGVAFDGGTAKNQTLIIGSGRMIPGFEEGITGLKRGEEKNVPVTFPENYPAKDLAGKAAEFKITVNELKKRVLPELNDDFAREAAKVDTLDAFKERIAEVVTAQESSRIEREFRTTVIDELLTVNEFEVPESLVKKQLEHSVDRMRYDLSSRGIDPKMAGLESDTFMAEARKSALRTVRWAFLADAIAKAEGIMVSDEDLETRLQEIADADGRSLAAIKGFFAEKGNLESLRSTMLEQKAFDKVLQTATIEEIEGGALAP